MPLRVLLVEIGRNRIELSFGSSVCLPQVVALRSKKPSPPLRRGPDPAAIVLSHPHLLLLHFLN